jgi:tRNA A37 threonylcarbamoyladenosine dehydratase
VGSWAAEALARSGVGKLTLIDYDTVAESNINRQVHALGSTIDKKKNAVLAQRFTDINPECECRIIDDFLNMDNLSDYLSISHQYDYVLDAIDSIKFKSALIYFCKRNKIPVITAGGAGGVTNPASIMIKDLSRSYHDAMLAKVRSQLRNEYNFSKNTKRYFGVECIFSSQQKLYPTDDGKVSTQKPGIHGVHLDCRFGYGSAAYITSIFGMFAAGRIIEKILARRRN